MIALIFLFLIGFVPGCLLGIFLNSWGIRVFMVAVLWLPIAALLLLQYTEVVEHGTFSGLFFLLPRAIKYPMLGFLVGYSLETAIAATRQRAR